MYKKIFILLSLVIFNAYAMQPEQKQTILHMIKTRNTDLSNFIKQNNITQVDAEVVQAAYAEYQTYRSNKKSNEPFLNSPAGSIFCYINSLATKELQDSTVTAQPIS